MFAAVLLAAAAAQAAPGLLLEANGLGLPGGAHLRFGVPIAEAEAAVVARLGKPVWRGTYPDCGQSIPIAHINFRGKLELSAIKGRFSGWTLDEGGNAKLRSAEGIGLGSTLREIRKAQGDVDLDPRDEVVLFASETGPSGFLDGVDLSARAVALHAGETCIVD